MPHIRGRLLALLTKYCTRLKNLVDTNVLAFSYSVLPLKVFSRLFNAVIDTDLPKWSPNKERFLELD
jgi:hypothetical protein